MPAPIVYTAIEGFIGAAGKHPLFLRWREMKKRCANQNHASFHRYGGRGIRVCDRWMDFGLFVADMGMPPTDQHSIERRNNDGNYEPSNCRWATQDEQHRNMSSNVFIEIDGVKRTAAEWAKLNGVDPDLYWKRIKRLRWDPVDAITMPVIPGKKYSERAGK